MSRGVEHSASDQVSRDRPRVRIKPRRAAGRLTPRRGYGRRVILRIIMCHRPPECRCLRSFVTSDGIGGVLPSGDGPVVVGPEYGYGYG